VEADSKQEGWQLIGVDTNVLVRLCVHDDANQLKAALKLLSGAPPASVRISVVVLAELAWTLLRSYRLDRAALIASVEILLSRAELDIEGRSAVMTALQWYREGNADFADYLIAALNREAGAAPTYTFDERATPSPAFALVP
jgi:predicted nucleic-acid-binding protein